MAKGNEAGMSDEEKEIDIESDEVNIFSSLRLPRKSRKQCFCSNLFDFA